MLEVYYGLWLGNREEICSVDLKDLVDVIIYLGQEMNDERLTHKNSLPIVHYPLNDGHNSKEKYILLYGILSYFRNIYDARVLLCCRHGQSRSPSIAILYLMMNEGWRYSSSLEYIEKKVREYSPNKELLEDIEHLGEK